VALPDQFHRPITPRLWAVLEKALACPLPPLECSSGGLSFPHGWTTVWDVAAYLAEQRPGWEAPSSGEGVDNWREAQVFAGVRGCLIEALNVPVEAVVRSARLTADLGAE
jgi:hypothetical protein